MSLQNKTAIVTGASRGLGRAIAVRLAKAGANIACVARSIEGQAETVAAIEATGQKAKAYAVDVSQPAAVEEAVQQILGDFEAIDILVNNAGVTKDGLLARMSLEDWDAVLDTNLKGAFVWTKNVARPMAKKRAGRIINMSSIIGLIGNAGQANYAASKAGLIGFTKSVAREYGARGITCNAICPGFIETDMTAVLKDEIREKLLERVPLGRFGQVDDIAAMVEFLAGDNGSYITGQAIVVDGGMAI